MRYLTPMLVLFSMAIGVAWPSAHETFRIVGTITRVTDREMDVRTMERETITIAITKRTIVRRDKEAAELPLSVLATGQSVVVDAYGDNESDLEAHDVRIVPPIRGKPAK
jgi:hypothetical protein